MILKTPSAAVKDSEDAYKQRVESNLRIKESAPKKGAQPLANRQPKMGENSILPISALITYPSRDRLKYKPELH